MKEIEAKKTDFNNPTTILFEAEVNGYKIYGESEINKTNNYDKIKIYTNEELEIRNISVGEKNG